MEGEEAQALDGATAARRRRPPPRVRRLAPPPPSPLPLSLPSPPSLLPPRSPPRSPPPPLPLRRLSDILLCGYPPFAADDGDQAELFRQIKTGAYSFSGPEWAVVSDGAKDLVRKMLQVDPAVRLTAAEVLQHPWMEMKSEALPDVSLNASLAALKRLTARRRLKAAMNNVRSIVRMKMMMAARVTLDAKKHGITNADELEKVFVEAAAKPIGITRRASAGNYTLPPGVVVTAPGVVLPTPPPSAVATPAHSRVAAVPGVPQAGV